ncbi:rhodanese-like domain-containing protein [Leptothoe sp. PORK10 BA2]|uniref:rhodanese-like domain-containing protein n=1 Tax=Leptothoe sp. PORK10 BA2 TaxID=3110254 RepID=UPI002B21F64A|nr:rhodanese-like domain-containing protein [Leptothoe sp. PORK10 BA2]MEA5466554.1 rhodanese-like domain-containing protein [Leptothoe sp. PORK10 BA2]
MGTTMYRQGSNLVLVACLCLHLAACGAMAETSAQISQQALVTQIESGAAPFILDVRTAEEYAAGHIPGAINIHFQELGDRLDELPDEPIVVYCERGVRANIAEQTLREAGVDSVLHLEGDMSLWRKNNLPLEREGVLPESLSESSPESERPLSSVTDSAELAAAQAAKSLEQRWIVSATEAKQLIDQGATLLDTRKLALTRLQNAVYADWKQFSPGDAVLAGKLLDQDAALTQRLQSLGISQHTPVVVFADPPGGWGEDGRIVWMLRTLGHSQVVLVDGGFKALVDAGVPVRQGNGAAEPGDFVVERNTTWEIQRDQLKAQLGEKNFVVIDTREAREYAGKTPYGEQRGGHVPGAINLYFKEFMGQDGRLLPANEIRSKLLTAGITPETQVVVYCTGGIRSGWLAAVLVSLGYSVKNYAGSMWEWSAAPAKDYPLEML